MGPPGTRGTGPGPLHKGWDFSHPSSKGPLGAADVASRRGCGFFLSLALGHGLPRGRCIIHSQFPKKRRYVMGESADHPLRRARRLTLWKIPARRPRPAPPRPARSTKAQCCPPARPALGRRRGTALFGGARVRFELHELLGHLVIAALRQDAQHREACVIHVDAAA